MSWTPRPSDVAWARNMVETMKQGGLWAVPMNGAVYRFDKATKTLWLVEGPKDDVFDKNVAAFGKVGYRVAVSDERQLATDGSKVLQGVAAQQAVSSGGIAPSGS